MAAILASPALHAQSPGRPVDVINKDLLATTRNGDKVRLLTELATAYTRKPGEDSADLQTARRLLDQATTLNNNTVKDPVALAGIYLAYAESWHESGKRDVVANIPAAIAICKRLGHWEMVGDCYVELKNDIARDRYEARRNCLDTALLFYRKAANARKKRATLCDLADYNQLLNNYDAAMLELNEATLLSQAIHKTNIEDIYSLYAEIYTQMGNYPEAVRYGLMSLKTAQASGDSTEMLGVIYYRIACAYGSLLQSDSAAKYLRLAENLAIRHGARKDAWQIAYVLTSVYTKLHAYESAIVMLDELQTIMPPANANDSLYFMIPYVFTHMRSGNYKEAKRYATVLRSMAPRISETEGWPREYYGCLFAYALSVKDFTQAKLCLEILRPSYNVKDSPIQFKRWYERVVVMDTTIGNFYDAYIHARKAHEVSDSLLGEKQRFQLSQIQALYETDAHQKSIALLQAQHGRQQIVYTRNTIFVIISIVAVFVLLIVLWWFCRIKQKNNRKLTEKQQEINGQHIQLMTTADRQKILIEEKNVLLADKEWLLKEVHHRVKNNLQIVVSLLNQQAAYLTEKEAVSAIEQSKSRMQAISLIHQLLYQEEGGNRMNMKVYIETLASYLADDFAADARVRFSLQLAAIRLDISQAIPLGLLLNETITNAIKYAFKGRSEGMVCINLQKAGSNISLTISDNGVGFAAGLDWRQSKSMGLQLVKMLVQQLNGDVDVASSGGVSYVIVFPEQTD